MRNSPEEGTLAGSPHAGPERPVHRVGTAVKSMGEEQASTQAYFYRIEFIDLGKVSTYDS